MNTLPSREFVLMGDYNLPKTTWHDYNELSDSLTARCSSMDKVIFRCSGMKGYTLDLAFSTVAEGNFSLIPSSYYLVPVERIDWENYLLSASVE